MGDKDGGRGLMDAHKPALKQTSMAARSRKPHNGRILEEEPPLCLFFPHERMLWRGWWWMFMEPPAASQHPSSGQFAYSGRCAPTSVSQPPHTVANFSSCVPCETRPCETVIFEWKTHEKRPRPSYMPARRPPRLVEEFLESCRSEVLQRQRAVIRERFNPDFSESEFVNLVFQLWRSSASS